MPNEVWVYTEILPLIVPYTGARASPPLSLCASLDRRSQKEHRILECPVHFGIHLDRFDRLRHARVVSI